MDFHILKLCFWGKGKMYATLLIFNKNQPLGLKKVPETFKIHLIKPKKIQNIQPHLKSLYNSHNAHIHNCK